MKRFRRTYLSRIALVLLAATAFVLRWALAPPAAAIGARNAAPQLSPGVYTVERVIDGDTIVLADGQIHVRLQGIDTPEVAHDQAPAQPYSREATEYTRQFLDEAGRRVRLEFDGETVDHYGRTVAFIWSGERLLNEELERAGLARARLQYNYSATRKDLLRSAQQDAQRAKLGLCSQR